MNEKTLKIKDFLGQEQEVIPKLEKENYSITYYIMKEMRTYYANFS